MVQLINQIFEVEQKLILRNETFAARNFKRIEYELELMGYVAIDPLHRSYHTSDTEIDATIVGEAGADLRITRVLKPIIYYKNNDDMTLLQKGIVIVE